MPMWEYKCEACSTVVEQLRQYRDRDANIECRACGARMIRMEVPRSCHIGFSSSHGQPSSGAYNPGVNERSVPVRPGTAAMAIDGPGSLTITNCGFHGFDRGIVAHPDANLNIKGTIFSNVRVPVERA